MRMKRIWLSVATLIVGVSSMLNTSRADDTSSSLAIRDALASGNASSINGAFQQLPTTQRQSWISSIHQQGGYRYLNSGNSDDGSGATGGNARGGAAIANYTNLMQLIEQTISPDQWQNAGGTSTMMPFRQGVTITPEGVIERVSPMDVKKLKAPTLRVPPKDEVAARKPAISLKDLGAWQQPTSLRWISLHQLDKQIAQRRDSGENASVAMELLGGIYRIDYVAYDKESKEWFIGGPAGDLALNAFGDLLNKETMLPPVLLEDLLGISSHVLNGQGEFGCSIDPNPARLQAAYAMAQAPSTAKALQRNPEKWTEEWRKTIGRQNATIVGLNDDSPTGYALLLADAHMKRLALGQEFCPAPMRTYWDEAEALRQVTNQGMLRWWFALSNNRIPMDPDRHIYSFEESNVQVMSETQLMNAKGERVVANTPDIAADAYARGFTRNFAELQRNFPVYGRLRHVFDLAVALEIVRGEIAKGNGKALDALRDPELRPRLEVAPRELDSIAATRKLPNGSITAVISGGVSISTASIRQRTKDFSQRLNSISVESSPGDEQAEPESTDPLAPKPDARFWR